MLCLLLYAPRAAAQSSATSAQVLFEEGRRLMQAGDYAAACPKLAESQRLDPGAGTLLNLAACYEKREQLASAWTTYTEAASDAARSNRPEWEKRAKEKAAALHPLLSTLVVHAPPGAEVLRDGHRLNNAELGVKVPVDGGEHVVEARAPGRQPWSARVTAPNRGAALVVTVPELAAAPADTDRSSSSSSPSSTSIAASGDAMRGPAQRTVGIVLGAAGIAGLAVGGVFTGLALSRRDEASGRCSADASFCDATGLERYEAAHDAASVATVAIIAGAALLVGGVVLYLTAGPKRAAPAARTALGTFAF